MPNLQVIRDAQRDPADLFCYRQVTSLRKGEVRFAKQYAPKYTSNRKSTTAAALRECLDSIVSLEQFCFVAGVLPGRGASNLPVAWHFGRALPEIR